MQILLLVQIKKPNLLSSCPNDECHFFATAFILWVLFSRLTDFIDMLKNKGSNAWWPIDLIEYRFNNCVVIYIGTIATWSSCYCVWGLKLVNWMTLFETASVLCFFFIIKMQIFPTLDFTTENTSFFVTQQLKCDDDEMIFHLHNASSNNYCSMTAKLLWRIDSWRHRASMSLQLFCCKTRAFVS